MAKQNNTDITVDNLVIGDPQAFKPTELPLVIKPPEGQDWLNDEQAKYAKVLNAAAYSNHAWTIPQKNDKGEDIPNSSIRDVELGRLVEIGKNPSKYYLYTGETKDENGKFSIKNKLLE